MKRSYPHATAVGLALVALCCASCKSCKPEEPVLAPEGPETGPPEAAVVTVEEDAGPDADADADAKKIGTGTYDPTKLMACCNALAQNAKSAPPTQAPFMLQAAAACKAAAASGNLAGVTAALATGGMGGCK